MREIKFRAWHRLNKEMLYEGWTTKESGSEIFSSKTTLFMLGESAEIMQYTGLKDKNGKEIYEGDILQLFYPRNYGFAGIVKEEKIVKIEFQSGGFWFLGDGVTDCNWHFYNSEDRKVIGNIYENANLLEIKKALATN